MFFFTRRLVLAEVALAAKLASPLAIVVFLQPVRNSYSMFSFFTLSYFYDHIISFLIQLKSRLMAFLYAWHGHAVLEVSFSGPPFIAFAPFVARLSLRRLEDYPSTQPVVELQD